MKININKLNLDRLFGVALVLKSLNAVLEIFSGLLLIIIKPEQIIKLISVFTSQEITEDPKDIIANFLIKASHGYSISANTFWVFYLLSHGIIKIILVGFLFKRQYKIYPIAIAVFILFLLYEVYKLFVGHSFSILILIIIDIIIVYLTILEYRKHHIMEG